MINIHATCVVLGCAAKPFRVPADAGVLLTGESGSGKSDLALRLIASGAILVADDRCELYVSGEDLRVRAPPQLHGLVEVRGVGIVPVPFCEEAIVRLVVRLDSRSSLARLPDPRRYRPPAELAAPERIWPPEVTMAPFETSAPAKIVAAMARSIEGIPA